MFPSNISSPALPAKLYYQNPASNQTSGNTPEKGPAVPQHLIGQGETEGKFTTPAVLWLT
jgi:hypothetical protein